MDDIRVLWMRDRVYTAFNLNNPMLFEEMLSRDDGEAEDCILHFLNHLSDEDNASALFFYRILVPEEVEVEEPGEREQRLTLSPTTCPGPGSHLQFSSVL